MLKRRFLVAALCRNDRHAVCHSIFARSLARSSFNGPHGMSLTHAACDQPLMNSPITKLKFCHSERSKESLFVLLRSFRSVRMTGTRFVILNAANNCSPVGELRAAVRGMCRAFWYFCATKVHDRATTRRIQDNCRGGVSPPLLGINN